MKKVFILISVIVLFVRCNQKNELNNIAFEVSKDAVIDSLKTATDFFDMMDYGNGAACFVVDDKLHYTKKEPGFNIVDIPKENASITPIIEPFDEANSKRLFNLIYFLNKNGIDNGMGKSADGKYSFEYKQKFFNPHNSYNNSRYIIYMSKNSGTMAKPFYRQIILDRYKNIILVAPVTYNEPKLPMDSASIMKRRDDLIKKRNEGNK